MLSGFYLFFVCFSTAVLQVVRVILFTRIRKFVRGPFSEWLDKTKERLRTHREVGGRDQKVEVLSCFVLFIGTEGKQQNCSPSYRLH